jgi:transcription antitermination factor NusG
MSKKRNLRKNRKRPYSPSALAHRARPRAKAVEPFRRLPPPPGLSPEGQWYVVMTAPRVERRVLDEVVKLGFRAYLPEIGQMRRIGRTVREFKLPFFRPYLFVSPGERGWSTLRQVEGVVDVLGSVVEGGDPVPLPLKPDFMPALFEQMNGSTVDPVARSAVAGGSYPVVDHPFAGFMALVEAVLPSGRIRATVEIFGRPTPVELEADQVRVA